MAKHERSRGEGEASPKSEKRRTLTLGLVPSPDHCEKIASRIKDDLPDALRQKTDLDVDWSIEVETDPLTGANVHIEKMLDEINNRKDRQEWDYAIALIDLPVRKDGDSIISEGCSGNRVAVVSVPALGVIQLGSRISDHLAHLINVMNEGEEEERESRVDIIVKMHHSLGPLRLVSGMVYANRPWTLFPSFKTTVATAFATGGYGLIFTTLWEIGNLYGYVRLVGLMIAAMVILVSWIILAHNLWEAPRSDTTEYQRSLYNMTTVATIASGVVFSYAIIFVMLLAAAFVYIPSAMLESTIKMPVTFASYVRIAWITSSVATIAGAIGAGLEDSAAVRNATFGWRQLHRWEEYNKQNGDDSDSS